MLLAVVLPTPLAVPWLVNTINVDAFLTRSLSHLSAVLRFIRPPKPISELASGGAYRQA